MLLYNGRVFFHRGKLFSKPQENLKIVKHRQTFPREHRGGEPFGTPEKSFHGTLWSLVEPCETPGGGEAFTRLHDTSASLHRDRGKLNLSETMDIFHRDPRYIQGALRYFHGAP